MDKRTVEIQDKQSETVDFGPFRLQAGHRRLLCGTEEVRLGGRAMDILRHLARNKGELVSRDDLIASVWPDVIVHESNLKVTVAYLRRALRQYSPSQEYINTVVGRGYWLGGDASPRKFRGKVDVPLNATTPLPGLGTIIGRDAEIAELRETMAINRLTTVVGSGGLGKTTVAVAAAQLLEDEGGGLVTFVDLARIASEDFVASSLAAALGIASDGGDRLSSVISILSRRKSLLLLDTCEHVLNAVARICEIVLDKTLDVRIVATSRQLLGVRGEKVVWLAPLEVPPVGHPDTAQDVLRYSAPQLLEARAFEKTGYRITDQDARAIAEICRRLDGVPLAIDLISNRLNDRSADTVLGELDDRFRTLRKNTPGGPLRQQTMLLTLEWSYALLTRNEATIFRAISIFAGAFTDDSIVQVAGDIGLSPADIADGTAGLLAKSMLNIDRSFDETHYRLLDSTRAFAGELLVAHGERDEISKNHALLLRGILRRANAVQAEMSAREWRTLCSRHVDDLRKAIDWALDNRGAPFLGVELVAAGLPLWQELSLDGESQRNCKMALAELERLGSPDPSLKLALTVSLAMTNALVPNDTAETIATFQSAIELARVNADAAAECRALGGLAMYLVLPGDHPDALKTLDAMHHAAIRSGDPFALWEQQHIYAYCEAGLGHFISSYARLEKIVAEMAAYSERNLLKTQLNKKIMIHTALAANAWYGGRPGRAQLLVDETLRSAQKMQHDLTLAYSLIRGLILTLIELGDYKKAEHCVDILERTIDRSGLASLFVRVIAHRATLSAFMGTCKDPETLRHVFELLQKRTRHFEHDAHFAELARAMLEAGYVEDAAQVVDFVLDRRPQRWVLSELRRIKAATELALGRVERSETILRASLRDADTVEVPGLALRAAYDLASLLHGRGASAEARQVLAPIYGKFVDGFETRDMRRAGDLLAKLT